ncbi:MAG: hypothetical protein GX154_11825 [Clostridiales bacterium]|nr:hypothetical protein [Clostridiales bacterium]
MLTCNIIMDLVSIYHDGVASEDTVNAVNEHLEECRECKEFYEDYKKEKTANEEICLIPVDERKYHELSSKLRKRHIINTGLVSALTLGSGAYIVYNAGKTFKKKKK